MLDHGTPILVWNRVSQYDQVKLRVGISADAESIREPLHRCDAMSLVLQEQLARPEEFGVIRDGENMRHLPGMPRY